MNWELAAILVLIAALLIYVLRHIPKAIEQLKKELGD